MPTASPNSNTFYVSDGKKFFKNFLDTEQTRRSLTQIRIEDKQPNWRPLSEHFFLDAEQGLYVYCMPRSVQVATIGRNGSEMIEGDDNVADRHVQIYRVNEPERGYDIRAFGSNVYSIDEIPVRDNKPRQLEIGDIVQLTVRVAFIFYPEEE